MALPAPPQCDAPTARNVEDLPHHLTSRPSKQDIETRARLLRHLQEEPPSKPLRDYFEKLKTGSPNWDIDTFIEGAKVLSNLTGPQFATYYGNSLKGLHYPTTFTRLWNQTHPQHPITFWDLDFRRQCPPSWFNGLKNDCWVLTYRGEAPLSQGLNELLKGPTTIDCGMWCQLLLWMSLRYLIGDERFDTYIPQEGETFTLTQNWDLPMNNSGTIGNLLYPFYNQNQLGSQARIQTRTFWGHPKYKAKHPGGMGQLQNVICIDGCNYIFGPHAPRNVLSDTEVRQKLVNDFNAPRDESDLAQLWLYDNAPDFVHPHFFPRSYGTVAKEAAKHADDVLDGDDWIGGHEPTSRSFNFTRLIKSVEK